MPLSNSYLLEFSTHTFAFSAATKMETIIIEQLTDYVNRLKKRGVFVEDIGDVLINAVYNKAFSKSHQITVECIPSNAIPLSFGNSVGTDEDEVGETWQVFQGKWNYTIQFNIKSVNRASVAMLADIILVGLLKPVHEKLLKLGVEIPINNMSLGKIIPYKEPGYEHLFTLTLEILNTTINWVQLYREDGLIAREAGIEISRGE